MEKGKQALQVYAGFHQVDITPDYPVDLIGIGREDSMSRGIHTPLYAQALVLAGDFPACCLLAIDNIGLSVRDASALRQDASRLLGTRPAHVMVCCSHSHATPNTDAAAPNGTRAMRQVHAGVLAAVRGAMAQRVPVKAGWAHAHAAIGVNRRPGGTALDDRIGVLRFAHAQTDEPFAAVLRVTAHGNVLKGDSWLISSDFIGRVREDVAPVLGCPVLVTQGASGNVRPRYEGSASALERMGAAVLRAVQGLAVEARPIERLRMGAFSDAYASDVPDEEGARRIAEEARRACGIDGTAWFGECARLRAAGTKAQWERIECAYLQVNDGGLFGVPHEVFVEAALQVAQGTGPHVFLGGYTNGHGGYLPGDAEWRKGGYETLYSYLQYYPYVGRVMPLRPDALDTLTRRVCERWREIAQ